MADLENGTDADGSDDIKAMLSAAFDEASAPEATPEPAPKSETGRDIDGKFAKKSESSPDIIDAPKPDAKPDTEAKVESPVDQKPETKPDDPPALANWKVADKELLRKQPAEVQEFMLRRQSEMDAEFTRKTQTVAQLRREYEPVQQLFTPYTEAMVAQGYTPAKLVSAWMDVEKGLMEGRGPSIIKSIVENYKIDRAALARELGIAPSGAPPDPNSSQPIALPPEYQQKFARVEQFIAHSEAERQAQAQQAFDDRASRVMTDIDQFRSMKGPNGVVLHPHFADVEDDMTAAIHSARARGLPIPTLDQAYDQAVWANPSTRASLQDGLRSAESARIAAEAEKTRTDARAKAEKARAASSSVRGAPSSGYASGRRNGTGSLRDDLVAASADADAA